MHYVFASSLVGFSRVAAGREKHGTHLKRVPVSGSSTRFASAPKACRLDEPTSWPHGPNNLLLCTSHACNGCVGRPCNPTYMNACAYMHMDIACSASAVTGRVIPHDLFKFPWVSQRRPRHPLDPGRWQGHPQTSKMDPGGKLRWLHAGGTGRKRVSLFLRLLGSPRILQAAYYDESTLLLSTTSLGT